MAEQSAPANFLSKANSFQWYFFQKIHTQTHLIIFKPLKLTKHSKQSLCTLVSLFRWGSKIRLSNGFCLLSSGDLGILFWLTAIPGAIFLWPYLSGLKIELQSVTVVADWMSICTAWSCGLMLEHRSDPLVHPSQATVILPVVLQLQRKPGPDLYIPNTEHYFRFFCPSKNASLCPKAYWSFVDEFNSHVLFTTWCRLFYFIVPQVNT